MPMSCPPNDDGTLLSPVGNPGEDADQEDAVEAADPVDCHRPDGIVHPQLLLDVGAGPDREHPPDAASR